MSQQGSTLWHVAHSSLSLARKSRSDASTKQRHPISLSFEFHPGSSSRVNENQDENDKGNEGTSNPTRSSTPLLTPSSQFISNLNPPPFTKTIREIW
ncbi:hypothetical protein Tco_0934036 [Tanacetum coccineum]